MRQRLIPFVVFGLILVLLSEWNVSARKLAPLNSLSDFWLEFCIGNAGDSFPDPAVTIVRINDSYEPLTLGEENPAASEGKLSRLDYATILGFIGKLDPRSVAFLPTPTFDESLILNQTDIVPLKDAAMQLPRLTVAANVSNDGEQAKDAKPLTFPYITVEGEPDALYSFTRTVRRPDPQILANADPAFKSIESVRDLISDESIRIPLVAEYKGKIVPSLVLKAIAHHAGVATDEIVLDLTGSPKVRIGEFREVPILNDGTFVLPQRSGVRRGMKSFTKSEDGEIKETHHFTSLTVEELAYTGGQDDEVAKRILASFQGKFDSISENLVVVGFDRSADRRIKTVRGEALSETLMLARAIATIQSGRFIEWWPDWVRWASILLIAGIAAVLFKIPRGRFVLAWAISTLAFFCLSVVAFRMTLTWTPPFFAFALFGLMLLIGLMIPLGKKKEA
ncbi:MAG: CHASE2 domain-containing protein [Verrucomicrobiales bacterium]|nr:CHASE2 domain-containing protein [Verrucomicrobiales bacterium]